MKQDEPPKTGKIVAAPGTCWKVGPASRVAILIDGEAYFAALRSTLMQAQRSVYIVGWDIDSRTCLVPDADDGAPATLGELLRHIVETRPELEVRLLLWDYSVLYALDREFLPELSLGWSTPPQIHVCLDDVLPLGASHHQKIVVVDDAVAFCGGLDLTIRRWDTSEHSADDPARVDPDGKPYPPFHDLQMAVDGAAASALAALVRERWSEAACETPIAVEPEGDPWPQGVTPDLTDVEVGVARTRPAQHGTPEVREVEELYLRAIGSAERAIYIENQYLTTASVAEALVRRMKDRPDLECVVIGPKEPEGWLEARTMGAGRLRFTRSLREAGLESRFRAFYPVVPGDGGDVPVMVHAKMMIVDDILLLVGSANLNNRSMGLDTECNLVIEAETGDQRRIIGGLRERLLAEHLGVAVDDVERVQADTQSLISTVDQLAGGPRSLRPIEDDEALEDGVTEALGGFADAERPAEIEREIGDLFGAEPAKRPLSRLAGQLAIAAVILTVVLAFRWSSLGALDLDFLSFSTGGQVYLGILAIYLVAALSVVPIAVVIAATAMVLGPWEGPLVALAGSQLGAAVSYLVGRAVGRPVLRRLLGARLNRVSRALGRDGVLPMTALRMMPVASFTLINLVAGASRLDFRSYMAGTVLGMMPGVVIMTILGDRLRQVWEDPNLGRIAAVAGAIALWIVLSIALQVLAARIGRIGLRSRG